MKKKNKVDKNPKKKIFKCTIRDDDDYLYFYIKICKRDA